MGTTLDDSAVTDLARQLSGAVQRPPGHGLRSGACRPQRLIDRTSARRHPGHEHPARHCYPAGSLDYRLSSFTRGLADELIEIAAARFAAVPSPMTAILLVFHLNHNIAP